MSTNDIDHVRAVERVLEDLRRLFVARTAHIGEERDKLLRHVDGDRQRAAQVAVEAIGAIDATRWATRQIDGALETNRLSYRPE